ncbi:tetratricopeptide repeat protein [Aquisphaera insulae]|uniref:tetratricopeptide repeat protein n=1 Tax=Aquisphaera insulae TaxID=2712864 RepID=UPI0013ED5EB9|nr:tetratricopeptide repeat protein [Aquisphaera insulae]
MQARTPSPDSGLAWRVSFRVALVAFAAFAAILDNDFVAWDDRENFVDNPAFRGLGPSQLGWAWTTFWMGVYQPIAWMLASAEHAASGLNPRGYHLTSLFLHAACAVALYVLTLTILKRGGAGEGDRDRIIVSGLAAGLFAVHPLRVEVVAWASSQAYLPCALFAMLSVICYLRADPGREAGCVRDGARVEAGWLTASLGFFLASLLCKAAALGLPLVLLILDAYPLGRIDGLPWRSDRPGRWRPWLEKVPFFVLAAIFAGLAVAAKRADRTLIDVDEAGIPGRIAIACYGVWFYLIKTAWPAGLHAFTMRPRPLDWTQAAFLAAVVGVIVVTFALWRLRHSRPAWLAAWGAYLAILAPMSGLVTYGRQLTGDRYSYLAMIPVFVLMAAGLVEFAGGCRARRIAVVAVGLACGLGLTVLAWRQCWTWGDSSTLWAQAVAHGGDGIPDLHNNLGVSRAREGDMPAAIVEFERAIQLRPDYREAHLNLANAQAGAGDLAGATRTLRIASWRWPEDVHVRGRLGKNLYAAGRYDEAADEYRAVVRLRPEDPDARTYLAQVMAKVK